MWIRDRLRELELASGAVALDVGSSTLEYRTVVQPHIEENVIGPLRGRGVEVRSLDFRDEAGVDYRCDLTAPGFDREELIGRDFPLVLCNNVLVHLADPSRGARAIATLLAPGGILVATSPACYRRVRDPLDNGLRPTPVELASLLIDSAGAGSPLTVVAEALVRVDAPCYYRRAILPPSWFPVGGRWIPAPGLIEQARYKLPGLRWRVSCVVLRRSGGER